MTAPSGPAAEKNDWVVIGKLGAPHGLQGEIRLYSLSDVPDRFETLDSVWWMGAKGSRRKLKVAAFRPGGHFHWIRFHERQTREAVSELRNGYLVIPAEQRGVLPQGRYYIDDVIGLMVEDEHGRRLGRVGDVISTGANDIYVVQGEEQKEMLLPALKEYIVEIDLGQKRMRVRVPEGY
ncbi:16S rRNA processing protein RimM [candidate division FCPU426 bacterium]|nr:16S rRNA processing protein RimM [candidate division FCPU426 bacterium]